MALNRILKFSELPERRMPNGATIRPLVDKESCGARIKTNTVSFPAGHAVEFHRHNCNEMIVVLAGDCAVEIEGDARVFSGEEIERRGGLTVRVTDEAGRSAQARTATLTVAERAEVVDEVSPHEKNVGCSAAAGGPMLLLVLALLRRRRAAR